MNVKEGKNSIFRDMMEQNYLKELEEVRSNNYHLNKSLVISQVQLSKNPPR